MALDMNNFIEYICEELYYAHYNYYNSVYMGFLKEAVKNTIDDLEITTQQWITSELIETIHKHIKENYI